MAGDNDSGRLDLDAIRSRAACAYGTHECDFDGCDGSGPWPIPWTVVDDIKGDGHWDNEFHVLTEGGKGSFLATFEYRPHAVLFANAVADIAALLAEVERLRDGIRRLHAPVLNVGADTTVTHLCGRCTDEDGVLLAWPCPTAALLDDREETT